MHTYPFISFLHRPFPIIIPLFRTFGPFITHFDYKIQSILTAVNVMMLALPSMTKRIRRYEKHKAAVEQAGDDNIEIGIDDEIDEDDEDIENDVYNGSDADLLGTTDGSVVESNPRSKPRRKVTQRQRKVTQGIAIISPQALSLTSFLPILGAAAATVGTPSVNLDEEEPPSPKYRKRKSTRSNTVTHVPHVISRPHSALPPTPQQHDFFFYPTTSESHLPLSDRNQQYLQNREHIWNTRAKFFRSTSGPALLDAKSPLMLRRFVLDPENDPEPKDLSERTVDFQDYQEPSFLCSRSSSIHSLPSMYSPHALLSHFLSACMKTCMLCGSLQFSIFCGVFIVNTSFNYILGCLESIFS